MFDPKGPDREDPISVRLPESTSEGNQPLLNEDGYANLSRRSLYELFNYDPDAIRRLSMLLEPEEELN
ncbi:hypothetical protein KJ657_05035 [Patescibacteria group bacterium]|nr:hypothetical protein [Patescibacteria group bacterium]MBU1016420.1 hypothetical protein [Patescibacteria group bacterium]MBU1685168.1 hypothetical protein [Patescibacteria group bacterium]MBU1938825.1 hypothetical protein [Patescibacteria group bacterium]